MISAQIALGALLGVILLRFYRDYRRQYLQHWALGWWVYVVFHIATLTAILIAPSLEASHPARHVISVVAFTSGYLHILFVLLGTYELATKKPVSWRWLGWTLAGLPTAGLALSLLSAGVSPELRLLLRVGLRSFLAGLAFLVASVTVFRLSRRTAPFGMRLLAVALGLFGLLNWQYFVSYALLNFAPEARFILMETPFVVFGSIFDLLLQVLMGMGMVIWLLEEEQRKLLDAEGRLRHSQTLASLGRMAGGIAHDFNNLLTVILGYSEMLVRRLSGSDLERRAREVRQAAERGATLTTQLLAFSRKQHFDLKVIDLRSVVSGLRPMLQRLIGDNVELVTTAGSRPALLLADPHQVEQVIVNLALNARDAMPRGGRVKLDANVIESSAEKEGEERERVRLTVADDGAGMDPDVLEQMFEPFFTTKELGQGTGLGLSTVYGIVTQCGGSIRATSLPGTGTEVRVYFPLAQGAESGESRADEAESGVFGGSETILVVEDEPVLNEMVRGALEERGYRVHAAEDGSAALELSRRLGTIDLLLTDVLMPGLSGPVLAEELRKGRPELKVVLMSGYMADISHFELDSSVKLLKKPFTPQELCQRVHDALHRSVEAL